MKEHDKFTYNPPIRICANKIENTITFRIKTGYYLKLLTSEMMKLLGSTKNKITKDEAVGAAANNNNIEVILKYYAPFTDSIIEMKNTHIDNAKDTDVRMPMDNLIESSKNI